jgi:hypothetical protein
MVTFRNSATTLLLALLYPTASINAIDLDFLSQCSCPLLVESECNACATECSWLDNNACQAKNASGETAFVKWNGFMELAQTHVIKASGETRHAPKPIAEREAELLFTPTQEVQATLAPTPSPTRTIEHAWGLEQLGMLGVEVPPDETWASGFVFKPESNIIQEGEHQSVQFVFICCNFNADDCQSGQILLLLYHRKPAVNCDIDYHIVGDYHDMHTDLILFYCFVSSQPICARIEILHSSCELECQHQL